MKKIKLIYKFTLFCTITFMTILTTLYIYAYLSPKITLNSANAIYLYDNKDELIFQTSNNNSWVNIKDISQNLINATISTEDKNFYNHQGFDYLRIAKAMYINIKNKTISNIKEVVARGAYSIIIARDDLEIDKDTYDILIKIPKSIPLLDPILTVVMLQLISYHVAKLRKTDIDKPRNLAKSVTVE